jgi:hypothetical protein
VTSELFANPPLVGCRSELARLEALLERPPALAVIQGPPRTGKSPLLAAFGRRAAALGWRTIQAPSIGPDDEREAIVRKLRVLAGVPETLADSPTESRGEDLLGDATEVMERTAQRRGLTIVDGLKRRRTVVLIDGFRPAPGVEDWLLDELMADIRADDAAVIIAIAGRPPRVREAVARAEEVVEARVPTPTELRGHLSAVGRSLDPPAGPKELDVLALATEEEPALIGPLIRALGYARNHA